MKFWAVSGSPGCREKKPLNCHKYAIFGVVFSTFCGQKKIENFLDNILASSLKSYIA
jgi:hypothetical protein